MFIEPFIGSRELANAFHVSVKMIRSWRKKGMPSEWCKGRHVYTLSEVHKWYETALLSGEIAFRVGVKVRRTIGKEVVC